MRSQQPLAASLTDQVSQGLKASQYLLKQVNVLSEHGRGRLSRKGHHGHSRLQAVGSASGPLLPHGALGAAFSPFLWAPMQAASFVLGPAHLLVGYTFQRKLLLSEGCRRCLTHSYFLVKTHFQLWGERDPWDIQTCQVALALLLR